MIKKLFFTHHLCSVICKPSVLSLLSILFSAILLGQNYQLQWGIRGGGFTGSGGFDHNSEQIYDVKVGSDNHYYFIGTLQGKNLVNLNGIPVNTYNTTAGGNDIFLFSTTCDGTVRWSRPIGGRDLFDAAYNLVLDTQNNVYVGVFVGLGDAQFPVHFSDTNTLPGPPANGSIVSDFYKTSFLVKYDSQGNLLKRQALQGDVKGNNFSSQITNLAIDSNNNLHFMIGLAAGTHLSNNVTVPSSYTNYSHQFYLAKYDSNLNYISSVQLPIAQGTYLYSHNTDFAYDPILNRYYLSASRSPNITGPTDVFSFDNKPIVNRTFVLAINGSTGSEVWRRELYTNPVNGNLAGNIINSIAVDSNSDVYFSGLIFTSAPNQDVKIYDPNQPATTTYTFQPSVYFNIPLLVKLNSSGIVQWTKTPTSFAPNYTSATTVSARGIAFNGNEVALAASDFYFTWDGFSITRPQFYQPDPVLLRFNKQTGATLGMHDIKGGQGNNQYMTAVAKDNDGNYVVGGAFISSLFTDNVVPISQLVSAGHYDLFVAKLAASACGTPVMGTRDIEKSDVNVYPNPTSGMVNIESKETLLNYEIYTIAGQLLEKSGFNKSNTINLGRFSSGNYLVKITTLQGTKTLKIVKE